MIPVIVVKINIPSDLEQAINKEKREGIHVPYRRSVDGGWAGLLLVHLARQSINQHRCFFRYLRQRFQIDGFTGCVRAAATGAYSVQPRNQV